MNVHILVDTVSLSLILLFLYLAPSMSRKHCLCYRMCKSKIQKTNKRGEKLCQAAEHSSTRAAMEKKQEQLPLIDTGKSKDVSEIELDKMPVF